METANDKVTLCIRKPELSKESINNDEKQRYKCTHSVCIQVH